MQENRSAAEQKIKPRERASSLLGDQENSSLGIAIIAQSYQPKDIKKVLGKDLALSIQQIQQLQISNIKATKQEATESELDMASQSNS